MNHRPTVFAVAYALLRAASDHSDHVWQSDFDAQCKGATDAAPVKYKHDNGTTVTVGTHGGRRACLHHVLQVTTTQGVALTDFGMNGAYCLDQSWHHSCETAAALLAALKADQR